MDLLNRIRRYRNAYKNYISVMWGIYTKKEPLKCILKDDSVHMWSIHKAWQYTYFVPKINESNVIDYFDGKAEYLKLQYKDKGVVFYGADEMGDVGGIFYAEQYKMLKPRNEIVIDIGAGIADSSIYFALNGAKKVIGLEPDIRAYNFALKNININNLTNIITLINGGYGKDSEIYERKIKIYSLETLLNENGIDGAILKMDCEGCEYNLLNEKDDILRKFNRILMEYHHGYKNLQKSLKKQGFLLKIFGSYLYAELM